jgi:3'-phosphoadenosine 5'-phosphosulfate sulfotransferase (PAPS reductase)/FAD synthetase
MKKKRLLVSFSGGETSGYMAQWLKKNKSEEYDMVFVFANTGEENEETLRFVNYCDKKFNLNCVWVEALVNSEGGKGTTHRIVDFETASRNGEPFEAVIKKYGIPNQKFPHCNRETKLRPIHSYIKNALGWKGYYTAIGIRYDEVDRMVVDRVKNKIIYPLIQDIRMTKQKINFWWSQQDSRLNLKGYQGNCKTCWKKSFRNLYTIAKETPDFFDFFTRMEQRYGLVTPLERDEILDKNGDKKSTHFFRGDKSVNDIFEEAKTFHKKVIDSHAEINYQTDLFDLIDEVESCDIFSSCGDN